MLPCACRTVVLGSVIHGDRKEEHLVMTQNKKHRSRFSFESVQVCILPDGMKPPAHTLHDVDGPGHWGGSISVIEFDTVGDIRGSRRDLGMTLGGSRIVQGCEIRGKDLLYLVPFLDVLGSWSGWTDMRKRPYALLARPYEEAHRLLLCGDVFVMSAQRASQLVLPDNFTLRGRRMRDFSRVKEFLENTHQRGCLYVLPDDTYLPENVFMGDHSTARRAPYEGDWLLVIRTHDNGPELSIFLELLTID
jgi:hypothetical protein